MNNRGSRYAGNMACATAVLGASLAVSPPHLTFGAPFDGSTIVSMRSSFQPGIVYRKYPVDSPVQPSEPWQLSFGVWLNSAAAAIPVTLSLDPAEPDPGIQILRATATLVPHDGLYANDDVAEHFELLYAGTDDPFTGHVDFLLTPDGFATIPLRVHLNIIDRPGFPVPFSAFFSSTSPLGDITGDGKLEILASGRLAGVEGLYAFDHTGNVLPGWPLRSEDPAIVNQNFSTPTLVDLESDGQAEVVVVGFVIRNLPEGGNEVVKTLYVLEGSGAIRWQVTDDFRSISIPAIADLDRDGDLDIVVGAGTNMKRFEIDGTPFGGWAVETLNDIWVDAPVIADVDRNLANGLEIVACTPLVGSPGTNQLYVWNQDGSRHGPMWPKAMDACHSPLVLDLDRSRTNGLEIVMAVDHGDTPPVDPETGLLNTFSVYAWHDDGSDASGWPHHFLRGPEAGSFDDRIIAPGSAGDLDGDGDMEVLVGTYGQGDAANGNLFVFHHTGALDSSWPQWAGIAQTPSEWGGAALGDLDGDNHLEMVTASFRGVYPFRDDGRTFDGFPKLTQDCIAQPMIADLDGNGQLEVVQMAIDAIYAWQVLAPSPDPQPWPRFRQNAGRTGTLIREIVIPVPTVSEVGLAATFCLLVCAGGYVIRRNARLRAR